MSAGTNDRTDKDGLSAVTDVLRLCEREGLLVDLVFTFTVNSYGYVGTDGQLS